LEKSPRFDQVEQALSATEDGWAKIQTALVANEMLRQELRRRSIPVRRVAAATKNDEDIVTIYIR